MRAVRTYISRWGCPCRPTGIARRHEGATGRTIHQKNALLEAHTDQSSACARAHAAADELRPRARLHAQITRQRSGHDDDLSHSQTCSRACGSGPADTAYTGREHGNIGRLSARLHNICVRAAATSGCSGCWRQQEVCRAQACARVPGRMQVVLGSNGTLARPRTRRCRQLSTSRRLTSSRARLPCHPGPSMPAKLASQR